MAKRKSRNEDEVFLDGAPPPIPSNNKKHLRLTSDVTDNDNEYENIQPSPSITKKSDLTNTNSEFLDQRHDTILGQKSSAIPERLLRKPDYVDATPPIVPFEEYEDFEGTPTGIEAVMSVAKDAERYNMSYPKRGTCLVFNHELFEEGTRNREGSNVDVDRIRATFSKLGFHVVVHDNLEYCDVMDNIKMLSRPEKHVDNDCVCVFVLTHGQDNDLLMAKDAAYTSDKIWKPFTADNCPTLAGKPKLFFFQACRGKKLDGGVRMVRQQSGHYSDQTDSVVTSYTIPTLSDFLIAHSCPEGFFSWRNPEEGTWYVKSLCKVLDEFAESTDLLKMLTMTARRVATDFESFHDKNPLMNAQKQIPSLTSTLTRDLYFTPK